jgi:hypothetical protein
LEVVETVGGGDELNESVNQWEPVLSFLRAEGARQYLGNELAVGVGRFLVIEFTEESLQLRVGREGFCELSVD